MAKRQPNFVCQSCGAVYNRWKGKCEACGGWNSIVEEMGSAHPLAGPVATRPSRAKGRVFPLEGLSGEAKEAPRTPSGIAELDRVTGGGFVRGGSRTDAKIDAGVPAGEVLVAGRRCPLAGRVSMDLIVVDVTDFEEGAVRRGDWVTLIGGELTVDEVGRRAGTIGYEILTNLGSRYARTYSGEAA